MKVLVDNGHGEDTSGKRSPNGKLREYSWTRAAAHLIVNKLCAAGIDASLVTPEEKDIALTTRVKRVNDICAKVGNSNVLLISLHNDAAGDGSKWCSARGFSSWISPKASARSKDLAAMLTTEAISRGLKGNRAVPKEKYWTANYYIVTKSNCPAVLTENLFQDNKEDVEYLLSNEGIQNIVDLHVEVIKNYIKKYSPTK